MENETVKVSKSKAEWQQQLSPEQYAVTRERGTERAFTGRYWDHHETGIYRCVCCGTALFASDTKFDSGCGWPSYFKALDPANVRELDDTSHGMRRTEIICNVCDAHLGHVFPDGPPPTGLRYCINSASLSFEPRAFEPQKIETSPTENVASSSEAASRSAGVRRVR